MTTITYTRTKNHVPKIEGVDWTAEDWMKHSDTNVFYEYWSFLKNNTQTSFTMLYPELKIYSDEGVKSKAYCDIMKSNNDWIEFLGNRGVFPKIIIYNNEYLKNLEDE